MTSCRGTASEEPEAADVTELGSEAVIGNSGLSDNERIIFLGDSITQAGVEPGGYVVLVDSILQASYPGKGIEVIGAGISGNKVPDLLARLDKDVLAQQPTLVVIYIGINDVWHWFKFDPMGTEKPVFDSGLRELISRISATGASVVLSTPSVIGETPDFATDEDKMLEEYAEVSRMVATDTGVHLCDLREAFKEYLVVNNTDKKTEGVLTTDGVHLNAWGNLFLAKQMVGCMVGG